MNAKLVALTLPHAAGLEVKVAFGGVWKQSLTELSGGQRSLLALSLILAMLLFKPAPIYILDEVRLVQNGCQGLPARIAGKQARWQQHVPDEYMAGRAAAADAIEQDMPLTAKSAGSAPMPCCGPN